MAEEVVDVVGVLRLVPLTHRQRLEDHEGGRRGDADGDSVPAPVGEHTFEFALDAGDPDELGALRPAGQRLSADPLVSVVGSRSRRDRGEQIHLDVD
ncbi:MAG TPA: hypothetical protein VKI23_05070 [Cellulomonadaceae bacterium]|nr:hypothetical protein [Cellulomonadaceae bacterium]